MEIRGLNEGYGALCVITLAVMLSGCTAQVVSTSEQAAPSSPAPSPISGSQASAEAVQTAGPFPKGSALCNDSLTDSNALNIATTTLSSDGQTLSVHIALDSPYPIHGGREFTVTMGSVQHQADYTVSVKETTTGGATASVTDEKAAQTTPVPAAKASITDQLVTAGIPMTSLPI